MTCDHSASAEGAAYNGEQDDGLGGVLYLWTCRDCRSTYAGPSLSTANLNARLRDLERAAKNLITVCDNLGGST